MSVNSLNFLRVTCQNITVNHQKFLIIEVYIKCSVNFRQTTVLAESLDCYQVTDFLGINTSISNYSFNGDQTFCITVIWWASKKYALLYNGRRWTTKGQLGVGGKSLYLHLRACSDPSQGMLRSTAGKSILLEVRDIETLL